VGASRSSTALTALFREQVQDKVNQPLTSSRKAVPLKYSPSEGVIEICVPDDPPGKDIEATHVRHVRRLLAELEIPPLCDASPLGFMEVKDPDPDRNVRYFKIPVNQALVDVMVAARASAICAEENPLTQRASDAVQRELLRLATAQAEREIGSPASRTTGPSLG
jgi:hypothetical protein